MSSRLAWIAGNSSLLVASCHGSAIESIERIAWSAGCDAVLARVRAIVARAVYCEVLIAPVRRDPVDALLSELAPELPPRRFGGSDFPVEIENLYERPQEAGVDRLLNALAARELAPRRPAIVVDFGTATSLTVLSADGAFAGGLIGLGLGAAETALARAAPALPEVAAAPGAFAELGTRAAIASGLFWQAVGGAQRLIDGARAELGGACWVVVTGGGARRLAPYLERVDHIDEAWTVRGLLIAAGVGAE